MKKALIIFLLAINIIVAHAQSVGMPVDLNKIGKDIADTASSMYYPVLLKRFQGGDTTFSTDQKRALYYGYSFQKDYSAYGSSDYEDSLRTVIAKDSLFEKDYERILIFSDSVLKKNPFEMRTLKYRRYAARKSGKASMYAIEDHQLDNIIDAILSTGDGKTAKTGLWVTAVPHEYEMLKVFGFEFAGSQSLIGECDYLTVKKNEWGIEGLYFNVNISMNQLSKMLGDIEPPKTKRKN